MMPRQLRPTSSDSVVGVAVPAICSPIKGDDVREGRAHAAGQVNRLIRPDGSLILTRLALFIQRELPDGVLCKILRG
jgi:hypothetical protein